jgi:hypothetical protein
MDRRFFWYKKELDQLECVLPGIIEEIGKLPLGAEWGVIEPREQTIAEAVLRLGIIEFIDRHLVPIRRRYTWADDQPVTRRNADGTDGWNFAVKAHITIASPRKVLRQIVACAQRARGKPHDPEFDAKTNEKWEKQYNEKEGLHSLKTPRFRDDLIQALSQWHEAVKVVQQAWKPPPDVRPKRLATQITDLSWEVEVHTRSLTEGESLLRKAGAFEPAAPRDHYQNPLGAAGVVWSELAPVIHGNHQRIANHLSEMRLDADGIAADLEYGLREEAGPTESQFVKCLNSLHNHFSVHAKNMFGHDDLLACGYVPFHFDGLSDKFKPWWLPLAKTLMDTANVMESAALPLKRQGGDGASDAENQGDRQKVEPQAALTAPMSASDLAVMHDLAPDALRKRLDRERERNLDCFIELDDSERKPRDPKYLYKPVKVQPIIDAMKREKSSGERPSK